MFIRFSGGVLCCALVPGTLALDLPTERRKTRTRKHRSARCQEMGDGRQNAFEMYGVRCVISNFHQMFDISDISKLSTLIL